MKPQGSDRLILAKWILPVSKPPLKDGAIWIRRGRIAAVGRYSDLGVPRSVEILDLGSSIVLPGLVNAHTHLEYSCLKGRIAPARKYFDWLVQMVELKRGLSRPEMEQGILAGVRELIRCGTALVADVTNTGLAARALQRSGLRGIIFFELVGESSLKAFFATKRALSASAPRFRIRPSPHAPHTVPGYLLHEMAQYQKKTRALTSIHLSESEEEMNWIRGREGPMNRLIASEMLRSSAYLGRRLSPVAYLKQYGLLNRRVLCVHCVHLDASDADILKKASCFVALCPRSNVHAGAGRAPVEQLIRRGIPLCIGTDSLASNTDLDLWNEMRAVKKLFPFLPHAFILRVATLNGAGALGFASSHGSIEPGKTAHFIYAPALPATLRDPYQFLFEEDIHEFVHEPAGLHPDDPVQS